MQVIWIALIVLAGYFLGSVSSAIVLIWERYHKDIRTEGSGNAGATNAARTHGLAAGLMTLGGDMLKDYAFLFPLGGYAQQPAVPEKAVQHLLSVLLVPALLLRGFLGLFQQNIQHFPAEKLPVQAVDHIILALCATDRPGLRQFLQMERDGGRSQPKALGKALHMHVLDGKTLQNL